MVTANIALVNQRLVFFHISDVHSLPPSEVGTLVSGCKGAGGQSFQQPTNLLGYENLTEVMFEISFLLISVNDN